MAAAVVFRVVMSAPADNLFAAFNEFVGYAIKLAYYPHKAGLFTHKSGLFTHKVALF